jgi:hypothetical protein
MKEEAEEKNWPEFFNLESLSKLLRAIKGSDDNSEFAQYLKSAEIIEPLPIDKPFIDGIIALNPTEIASYGSYILSRFHRDVVPKDYDFLVPEADFDKVSKYLRSKYTVDYDYTNKGYHRVFTAKKDDNVYYIDLKLGNYTTLRRQSFPSRLMYYQKEYKFTLLGFFSIMTKKVYFPHLPNVAVKEHKNKLRERGFILHKDDDAD